MENKSSHEIEYNSEHYSCDDDYVPRMRRVQAFERGESISRRGRACTKSYKELAVAITVISVIAFIGVGVLGYMYWKTTSDNSSLKSAVDSLNDNYDKLENQFNEVKDQNDKLKADYDELKNNDDKLKEDYEALKKTKAGQKSDTGSGILAGKTVYLTFDDGPSPVTPKILSTLKKYGVKATFFVINGGEYNKYMADEAAAGHTVALHSYSHNYAKIYQSTDAFADDLDKIEDVVFKQTGKHSKISRFPGGGSNTISANYSKGIMSKLTRQIGEMGYRYFDWNVSSGDAAGDNVSADKIYNNVVKGLSSDYDRYVVLMHDAAAKSTTAEALPKIIEYIQANGGTIAALDENVPEVHHGVNN